MRILYHHRTRATDAQGIHIAEIVHAFESLGHTVDMESLVRPDRGNSIQPVTKARIRLLPGVNELFQLAYNLLAIPRLALRIRRRRPDFIYERYALFNFAGVLMGRVFNLPVVLEVNSPLALEQHVEGAIKFAGLARWSEKLIANTATAVIAVSTPLRRILEQNGIEACKLFVVPNGVNLEKFDTLGTAPDLRTRLGLEGKIVIGFAGWFKPWHGLELLLRAYEQSSLAARNAVLLLIGDGPAMPALKHYVQSHSLDKVVLFTGPVPHADMPQYVSLLDVAVQPAANEYCCPMKILEYMALGRVIVAPRQDNIGDVLRDDEAVFFEPGNSETLGQALVGLVIDAERRDELSTRARAAIHCRRLLWTANAERAVELAFSRPELVSVSPTAAKQLPCGHPSYKSTHVYIRGGPRADRQG